MDDGSCELKKRQSGVRFFEICDDFLNYSKEHKKSFQRDELSVKHLKAFFGNRPVESIKKSDVERYLAERKKAIRPRTERLLTPASVNRELSCLKTIFNRAIQDAKVEDNPVCYVKPLKDWTFPKNLSSQQGCLGREDQCCPDGYQELTAIQNEGSERVVNNEKSTTGIITKKHMAQAFCQGSQTTFGGARRAALTK